MRPLAAAAMMLCAGTIVLGLLPPLTSAPLNSDVLYLPALFRDLAQGRSLAGWSLTPAPYFVPDMLGVFPILLATRGDAGLAFVVYGIIWFFACAALVAWIGTRAGLIGRGSWACFVASLLLVVGLIQRPAAWPWAWAALWPTMHGGALLMGFALLATLIAIVARGASRTRHVLLAAIVACAVASDHLFVSQFLVPAIVALFIVRGRRETLVAIVAGAVIAELVRPMLGALGIAIPSARIQYPHDGVIAALGRLADSARPHLVANLEATALAAAAVLATAIAATRASRRVPSTPDRDAARFMLLFAVVSLATSLAAPVLGTPLDGQFWRYFVPLYTVPFVMLTLLLCQWHGALPRQGRAVLLGALLVATAVNHARAGWPALRPRLRPPFPPAVRDMDALAERLGVRSGVDFYWNAKPVSLLSARGVIVNQARPDFAPFHWIDNLEWHVRRDRSGTPTLVRPEFIVVGEPLDEKKILARFGGPARRGREGDLTVFVYDRPEDIAFRNFLRAPVFEELGLEFGSVVRSPANLQRFKPDSRPVASDGVSTIAAGKDLTIELARPVRGDVLELSANHDAEFDVRLLGAGAAAATVHVPRAGDAGLWRRFVALPDSIRALDIERVVIKPDRGQAAAIGHVYIYREAD